MRYRIMITFLFCMCLLVGCQKKQEETQSIKEHMDEIGENKSNIVMSEASIDFEQYRDYSIKLIMTNGQYYTGEETVPSVGVYEENYDGEYILQLVDANEEIVDEMSLNEDWGYENINFPRKFELCISDYNEDCFPDFTIGTAGSSSMSIYKLYSIDNEGKIINIGDFTDINKEFSIYLEQEEGSTNIYTIEWNNAAGEAKKIEWKWSEEGRYIRN